MNNLSLAPEHCTGLKKSELLLERMREFGIEQNCKDWFQYIKAKRLVLDMVSSPGDYDRLIRIVTDYVRV